MADWEPKLFIISIILVIIGGLNWGAIGLFRTNVIQSVNNATFRSEWLVRVIYILVGLAALYLIFKWSNFRRY